MKIIINGKEISEKICCQQIETLKMHYQWLTENELKVKAADQLIKKTLIDDDAKKLFPNIQQKQPDSELEKIKKKYHSHDAYENALKSY